MLPTSVLEHYWSRQTIPRTQIIIICGSEKRRTIMKQQMDEMQPNFPIIYLNASVPSNSQDFLPTNVVETYKKNLCYTRSHIRSLCIAADDRSPPYTVILDDDVSLHKKDFELVIKTLCSEWTVKNIKEPMISLGWNQSLSNSNLDTIAKSCPSLGNLTNYRLIDYEFLGSIGYVVRRDSIQDILPIINKPTFAELYHSIHSTPASGSPSA